MYHYVSRGYMESRRKGGRQGTSVLQNLDYRVEEDTGDLNCRSCRRVRLSTCGRVVVFWSCVSWRSPRRECYECWLRTWKHALRTDGCRRGAVSSLGVKAEREERVWQVPCYKPCNKFEKLELEDGKKVKMISTNKRGDRTLMRHFLSKCQASIARNWLHLSSGSNESHGNPQTTCLFSGPWFADLKCIVTPCCW